MPKGAGIKSCKKRARSVSPPAGAHPDVNTSSSSGEAASPIRTRSKRKTMKALAGDDPSLLAEMQASFKDPDDPPVFFDWDEAALSTFLQNANALAAAPLLPGALPPPLPPVSFAPLPATTDALRIAILQHIQLSAPQPRPTLIGTKAGLACTQNQFIQSGISLALFHTNAWVATVLAVGALPARLAVLFAPRPKVSTGMCDAVATLPVI